MLFPGYCLVRGAEIGRTSYGEHVGYESLRAGWQETVRQSKGHNFVGGLSPKEPASSCRNDHKLFAALLSLVGYWCSVRARSQLGNPQLFAGARVKSPETAICCCPDEYQPTRGCDRAAQIG